jgi:hypothetical protein
MGIHPLDWVDAIGMLPQQHVIVFQKKRKLRTEHRLLNYQLKRRYL